MKLITALVTELVECGNQSGLNNFSYIHSNENRMDLYIGMF